MVNQLSPGNHSMVVQFSYDGHSQVIRWLFVHRHSKIANSPYITILIHLLKSFFESLFQGIRFGIEMKIFSVDDAGGKIFPDIIVHEIIV